MHDGPFGSCCKQLSEAMIKPPQSFFRVESNGVLFLTVGSVTTKDGKGSVYFDQAIIYCPFCGTKIQDLDKIARGNAGNSPKRIN